MVTNDFSFPTTSEKGLQRTAAMQLINKNSYHDDQPMGSNSRPHNCDEALDDGEVKLAYGCMLPVVVGTFSCEGESKLKCMATKFWPK